MNNNMTNIKNNNINIFPLDSDYLPISEIKKSLNMNKKPNININNKMNENVNYINNKNENYNTLTDQ